MIIYYSIMILAFILDQASKYIIRNTVEPGAEICVIKGFFYITNVENSGAAWSILQGARWFFVSLTVIMIVVLFIYFFKINSRSFRFITALIIGGGAGNLLDRVISGKVLDFISLHFWNYEFPVFNISDSFTTVSTILLAIYIFTYKGAEKK
jgi:signal peptidase II